MIRDPKLPRTARALAVDDDADFLSSLREFLADVMPELTLVTEARPDVALQRLQGESFDLVLCDLRMPAMDGAEFLRQAKRIQPDTPCVLISAYGGEVGTRLHPEAVTADLVLLKPIQTRPFVEALRRLLRRNGRPESIRPP